LDFIKDLKESLSEDIIKDAENQVQTITDTYVKKVDEKIVEKEKDIMTI